MNCIFPNGVFYRDDDSTAQVTVELYGPNGQRAIICRPITVRNWRWVLLPVGVYQRPICHQCARSYNPEDRLRPITDIIGRFLGTRRHSDGAVSRRDSGSIAMGDKNTPPTAISDDYSARVLSFLPRLPRPPGRSV